MSHMFFDITPEQIYDPQVIAEIDCAIADLQVHMAVQLGIGHPLYAKSLCCLRVAFLHSFLNKANLQTPDTARALQMLWNGVRDAEPLVGGAMLAAARRNGVECASCLTD